MVKDIERLKAEWISLVEEAARFLRENHNLPLPADLRRRRDEAYWAYRDAEKRLEDGPDTEAL